MILRSGVNFPRTGRTCAVFGKMSVRRSKPTKTCHSEDSRAAAAQAPPRQARRRAGLPCPTTQHAHRRAATHPHAPHPPLPQSRICPRMLADVLSPPLRCRQMKRLLLLERPHPGGARSSSSKLVYSWDELATSCGAALPRLGLPPSPPRFPCAAAVPQPPPSPRATASRELRGADKAH